MPPVPSVPGRKIIRALESHGFVVGRIRGSHHVMTHPDGRTTTVPLHGARDVPRGTLRRILRDAGMSVAELGL